MRRKIVVVTATLALSMGTVAATADAGQAQDTGWDCPGCRHAGR